MPESAQRPRIALVGPVVPFRGGIAQHTTMLHRALAERADLLTLSFSRQYPKLLYPGGSDRDPALSGTQEPGVTYDFDTLDPFTWGRAMRRIRDHGSQALVVPWWTVYFAPSFGYLARAASRAGIRVVFMCHNIVEHEAAGWKTRLTQSVLRRGDAFVVHAREEAAQLRRLLPDARVLVYPHPVHGRYPEPLGTLPRTASLELLFFGFIRPYKGLDVLIEAMGSLADEDVHLTVAGEAWGGMDALHARVRARGIEDRIEFVTRYLSDREAAEYFGRADVVVLPYKSATGSAVVPVAYRYHRPVLVTDVGGLPDVVRDGETGLIVPPEDPAALAAAIRRFLHGEAGTSERAITEIQATMTWDGLADVLLDAALGQ